MPKSSAATIARTLLLALLALGLSGCCAFVKCDPKDCHPNACCKCDPEPRPDGNWPEPMPPNPNDGKKRADAGSASDLHR